MNRKSPIPHNGVRPPTFNRPIRMIKYCPLCGGTKGYTDAGKRDGRQMLRCRICLKVFPREAS